MIEFSDFEGHHEETEKPEFCLINDFPFFGEMTFGVFNKTKQLYNLGDGDYYSYAELARKYEPRWLSWEHVEDILRVGITSTSKLNRLAALEAVCGEIVESTPRVAAMPGFQTHYLIAQKLKAVLEEK